MEAVKLEGGAERVEMIRALVDAEIPVMGHLGLTPQSIHRFGGYRVTGEDPDSADQIRRDAEKICEAGVVSIVLEGIPDTLAGEITEAVDVPTIGKGAGRHCNGQLLVFHDLLGWTTGPVPRFVRAYADLSGAVKQAIEAFCRDVREGGYPAEGESYGG